MNVHLMSDFNIETVGRYLSADVSAPHCEAKVAPYGQVIQALAAGPPLEGDSIGFVWTRPEGVISEYARLLDGEQIDGDTLLAQVDAFASSIARYAERSRLTLVASWVSSSRGRGLGVLDWGNQGHALWLARMNAHLASRLAAIQGTYMLDAARWLDVAGGVSRPAKHWFVMKCPFSEQVTEVAAREIKAAIRASTGQSRKIVIVDLDDTLWGGIVGDDGWQNLRLGGHDHIGEAYVEFQRALKALTRRGIQVAIVSKNDEATALEAIDRHPEMVLRRDDLAGWRINWADKAQNVVDLTAALNLSLSGVVFIDDNPVERARVREALGDVLVPDWPASPILFAEAIRSLDCFDQGAITAEDRGRTRTYVVDRQRQEARASFESLDDWQASLDVVVEVAPVDESRIKRALQLINKTNQMTLRTRRLTEPEFRAWLRSGLEREAFAITVADRFGDLGLTGVLSWERDGAHLDIVDFVLSCRAMGRKVEETMVHVAAAAARARHLDTVVARAIPTARNGPCLDFWRRSGFHEIETNVFTHVVSENRAMPRGITLKTHMPGDVDQHSLRNIG